MKVIETPAAIRLQQSAQDKGKNVTVQEQRLRPSHEKKLSIRPTSNVQKK